MYERKETMKNIYKSSCVMISICVVFAVLVWVPILCHKTDHEHNVEYYSYNSRIYRIYDQMIRPITCEYSCRCPDGSSDCGKCTYECYDIWIMIDLNENNYGINCTPRVKSLLVDTKIETISEGHSILKSYPIGSTIKLFYHHIQECDVVLPFSRKDQKSHEMIIAYICLCSIFVGISALYFIYTVMCWIYKIWQTSLCAYTNLDTPYGTNEVVQIIPSPPSYQ